MIKLGVFAARVALPIGLLVAGSLAAWAQGPLLSPEDPGVAPVVPAIALPAEAALQHPLPQPRPVRVVTRKVQPKPGPVRTTRITHADFYGPPMRPVPVAQSERSALRERLAWQRPACISMACPDFVLVGIGF